MGGFVGGSETTNRTTPIYDRFPTKPMFSLDLEISGT